MTKATWLVCAGGCVLLALAGCKSSDVAGLFALQSDGHDRVIAGSLETVSQSAQGTLTQMGFATSTNRKGDSVRISAKTAQGSTFTLVFTKDKQKDSEQTRVHIEWDGKSDEGMGFQILGQLEAGNRH